MSFLLHEHFSLKDYNTFGLAASARYFASVTSVEDLMRSLDVQQPELILGGGSNILLTRDLNGLVVHVNLLGRRIIDQDERSALVEFGAGENWHDCVLQSLDWGFGGLENLSLIPGTVGAAPIQNIGAYGVELKDYFVSLEALELNSGTLHTFDAEACQFSYRDSFFKREGQGRFVICSVRLHLTKAPIFHTGYGAIQRTLEEQGVQKLSHKAISDAVILVRQRKLPDPAVLGNSGSFFKNPSIGKVQFESLLARFPHMVHYPLDNAQFKIPAGWLIEQCGWKGKRVGQTGAYAKQALVLVNYGQATGQEVWQLAQAIQDSVVNKFNIRLQPEVNVI
ncbi:MAG: UDP-N-acetylmuramate dehydrogenase [Bacteroidota bacterium]